MKDSYGAGVANYTDPELYGFVAVVARPKRLQGNALVSFRVRGLVYNSSFVPLINSEALIPSEAIRI